MSDNKKSMTLNLSEREMAVLEQLCQQKAMSKSAVMRMALRLFQIIDLRMSKGEKLIFENVRTKKKSELMVL